MLVGCSSYFALFVSGYTFADGVESVGDAAVFDGGFEETHCWLCLGVGCWSRDGWVVGLLLTGCCRVVVVVGFVLDWIDPSERWRVMR
jgi:hypothetical protein